MRRGWVRLQRPVAGTVPPVSTARSPDDHCLGVTSPGYTDGWQFPAGEGGRADQEMLLREAPSLIRSDTVQSSLREPGGLFLGHRGKALETPQEAGGSRAREL